MKPKPPCPVCGDAARVKTIAGGTKGMYRYMCENSDCIAEWQQLPPHKMSPTDVPNIRMKAIKKDARAYKCGQCGLPKRGHVCGVREARNDPDSMQFVQVNDAVDHCADDALQPPAALFHPLPFFSFGESSSSAC